MPPLTFDRRRWAAVAAVLALLCAQALGLAHRVSHGGAAALQVHAHDAHDGHHHAHAASSDFAWVGGEHDEGGTECRLIDQGCHADAMVAGDAAPAATPVAARDGPQRSAAAPARPAERPYSARAPPTFLA